MLEEKRLFELVKEKDEYAFYQLYNLRSQMLYYISYNIVRCREDADEVVQDTFIVFFNKINEIKNYNSFLPWIIKVTKNLSFSKLRARGHYHQYVLDNENVEEAEDSNSSNQQQLDDIIEEFKCILNEEEIEMVILNVIFGMKRKELAMLYEMEYSTFLKHYQKITNKIRKLRRGCHE